MTGPLLTADQLAERWQVSRDHVYRFTRDGTMPAVKLGRYCPMSEARRAHEELAARRTTGKLLLDPAR